MRCAPVRVQRRTSRGDVRTKWRRSLLTPTYTQWHCTGCLVPQQQRTTWVDGDGRLAACRSQEDRIITGRRPRDRTWQAPVGAMGGKRKGTGYAGNVFESPSPILGQPWQVPALADLPPIPPGVGFGCYYQPNASVGVPLVPSYRPCDPGRRTRDSLPCSDRRPGYFCPYVVDQVMLLCPPSPECFMNRLAGGSPCLVRAPPPGTLAPHHQQLTHWPHSLKAGLSPRSALQVGSSRALIPGDGAEHVTDVPARVLLPHAVNDPPVPRGPLLRHRDDATHALPVHVVVPHRDHHRDAFRHAPHRASGRRLALHRLLLPVGVREAPGRRQLDRRRDADVPPGARASPSAQDDT